MKQNKKLFLWIIGIFLFVAVTVLFSMHPVWLKKVVPAKIYGPIEVLTIVVIMAGLIRVFIWWAKDYFSDKNVGHWILYTAGFLVALVIIFGCWKGDPRDYFSGNQAAFAEENVAQPAPPPATTQTDKVLPETVDNNKPGTVPVAQTRGDVVDQDSLEIIKLTSVRDNEKTSFNEDSATVVKALKEAELRCERRKAQKEALIAEINMYKSKRQQLRNNPPVFNCDSYSRSTEAVKQASMQDFARLKEISDARKKRQ